MFKARLSYASKTEDIASWKFAFQIIINAMSIIHSILQHDPQETITHVQIWKILRTHFLCFVDRASLYNLVNEANLVHNLFLAYLSISTCFGRLRAHHQEKQLCLYSEGLTVHLYNKVVLIVQQDVTL
jgi:hypothetical protein